METRMRASALLSGLLLLGLAVPALADCPPNLSCSLASGPCTGTLTASIVIDTNAVSLLYGVVSIWEAGGGICFQMCQYDMSGSAGESWTMTIYDMDCDGSGTAIIDPRSRKTT